MDTLCHRGDCHTGLCRGQSERSLQGVRRQGRAVSPTKKQRTETDMLNLTRRQALMRTAATAGVTILGGTLGMPRLAAAATEITAVEWGGDVVNAMKQIE